MSSKHFISLFITINLQNLALNALKINGRTDIDGFYHDKDHKVQTATVIPIEILNENRRNSDTDTSSEIALVPPLKDQDLNNLASSNPILAALLLSYNLHLAVPKSSYGFNHPQHLPINPYVALLLSHYGRYVPVSSYGYGVRRGNGIYGYTAANNYHNNLPFGSYKIYADRDVR